MKLALIIWFMMHQSMDYCNLELQCNWDILQHMLFFGNRKHEHWSSNNNSSSIRIQKEAVKEYINHNRHEENRSQKKREFA